MKYLLDFTSKLPSEISIIITQAPEDGSEIFLTSSSILDGASAEDQLSTIEFFIKDELVSTPKFNKLDDLKLYLIRENINHHIKTVMHKYLYRPMTKDVLINLYQDCCQAWLFVKNRYPFYEQDTFKIKHENVYGGKYD